MSVTAFLCSVTQVFSLKLKLQSTTGYSQCQHGCFCFAGLSEMSFLEIEGRRLLNVSLRRQSLGACCYQSMWVWYIISEGLLRCFCARLIIACSWDYCCTRLIMLRLIFKQNSWRWHAGDKFLKIIAAIMVELLLVHWIYPSRSEWLQHLCQSTGAEVVLAASLLFLYWGGLWKESLLG